MWPEYGDSWVVTRLVGHEPFDGSGWPRHAWDSPGVGLQRTPMKPFAPVLFVMLTSTFWPLLESLSRLAMTAAWGRSSCWGSTWTSVAIVRVLLRAVDVALTNTLPSALQS